MTKATQPATDKPSEQAKAGAQAIDQKPSMKGSDPEVQKRAKAHADKATNEDG